MCQALVLKYSNADPEQMLGQASWRMSWKTAPTSKARRKPGSAMLMIYIALLRKH